MIKKILIIFIFPIFNLNGQFLVSMSQENENQFNPSFAGIYNKHIFNINIPYIIEESIYDPKHTYFLSYSGNINKINSGFGFIYLNDDYDNFLRFNSFQLQYNYKISITEKSNIRLGSQLKFIHFNSKKFEFIKTYTNFDFGCAYSISNFKLGITISDILKNEIKKYFGFQAFSSNKFKISNNFEDYVSLSFVKSAINNLSLLTLNNSICIKNSYYLNGSYTYKNYYLLGFGLKAKDKIYLGLSRYFKINNNLGGFKDINKENTLYYINLRLLLNAQ